MPKEARDALVKDCSQGISWTWLESPQDREHPTTTSDSDHLQPSGVQQLKPHNPMQQSLFTFCFLHKSYGSQVTQTIRINVVYCGKILFSPSHKAEHYQYILSLL